MSWRAWALILVAVAVLLVGKVYLPYVGWSNSNADARARADAYLLAVAGGSEDRGWSLLEASGRNEYGSEDTYRRLMVAADWSDFRWELLYYAACDDGVCQFAVRLPHGRDSVPESAWSDGSGDPGVLSLPFGAMDEGEALLGVVQRGWFGGIGIVVSGQTQ
jgi:hypothetical protein